MRHTHIRNISEDKRRELYDILDNNPDIKYRAKIVLLAGDGYTVPEIREMTNIYDKTIRKWIHRFVCIIHLRRMSFYSRMKKDP